MRLPEITSNAFAEPAVRTTITRRITRKQNCGSDKWPTQGSEDARYYYASTSGAALVRIPLTNCSAAQLPTAQLANNMTHTRKHNGRYTLFKTSNTVGASSMSAIQSNMRGPLATALISRQRGRMGEQPLATSAYKINEEPQSRPQNRNSGT